MSQRISHRQFLSIAFPMILSNITVPLLGLVDTAVVGHLPDAAFLGGIAVGNMLMTFLIWLFGFMRMSTTGLVAQAFGQSDFKKVQRHLMQSGLMALILAGFIILFQYPIAQITWVLTGASEIVTTHAETYFSIRVWGLPAATLNLVFLGVLIGLQKGKGPMALLIISNLVNMSLDVLFVFGFNWEIAGVAWASVIAEYTGLFIALYLLRDHISQIVLQIKTKTFRLFSKQTSFKHLILVNRDILIRSLTLQLCFVFMTMQGAKLGDEIIAANTVLLNFFMLISFVLDGVAYAAEAQIGQAAGRKDHNIMKQSLSIATLWTGCFTLVFTLLFFLGGKTLVSLLTDLDSVRQTAQPYLIWLAVLPLVATWCFLLDGVFVGLMDTKSMRNMMLISAMCGFLLPWSLTQHWGNHGLWFAMNCFMLTRSLSLGGVFFKRHWRDVAAPAS
ncbi:MATE family efflux transporter [Algicola sagamiensis]|uniref:MATE family efflux transporter n=1 Tax=Algicola sagamiensis TaxID=163869 RepID=UPI0003763691|nr:MATE family efflux transporter [Algicola sagamiensis]